MSICKTPNGEMYFFSKFNGSTEIMLKQKLDICIPRYLQGKKVRVKFEVINHDEKQKD